MVAPAFKAGSKTDTLGATESILPDDDSRVEKLARCHRHRLTLTMPRMRVTIDRLVPTPSEQDIQDLAALLLDAIDSGAGVSFMPGLTDAQATAWWRSVCSSAIGRAAILVARDDSGIVGTVQLQPSWAPNQPHRADIAKLMVHRRSRGLGIGRELMTSVERLARDAGLTLLVLDTCEGSAAERLYAAMGWQRVGVIPGFALNPDGSTCDTVFFYKQLTNR
jgi:GNAT superfamily N-acetyltransferase